MSLRGTRRGRLRPPAALGAAAVLLAACSAEVPAPRPAELPQPQPAVTAAQADRIVGDLVDVVAAGDRARDAAALEPRLDGAALEVRRASYAVAAEVPETRVPAAVAGERLLDAVPADGAWPRWFLTVTRASADAVPTVHVLTQAGPRDRYELAASADLLPGATLPSLAASGASDRVVAQALPTDETDLAVSPAEAVGRYAEVLTDGDDSQWAGDVAVDAFRTLVLQEQRAERDGTAGLVDYRVEHAPREGATWSLRAEDGGAVVVAVLDGRRSFTGAARGVRLPVPADVRALAGGGESTRELEVTSAEVVVLQVPPAGVQQPVQLVAASRGLVSAKAS